MSRSLSSQLLFRVRLVSFDKYDRGTVLDGIYKTYDEARKVANKYEWAFVEPHFEHPPPRHYKVIDFESGECDIDQSKLKDGKKSSGRKKPKKL